MTLSDLERVLNLCEKHLDATSSRGTEMESLFTRFLLVHICGEYEKEIKRIVIQRTTQAGDTELTSFVEKRVERVRNLKVDDLRGNILKPFSKSCLDAFDVKIKGKEAETLYQNIIRNRDLSAHGDSINMTFDELIQSHQKAKDVLQAMSDALNP